MGRPAGKLQSCLGIDGGGAMALKDGMGAAAGAIAILLAGLAWMVEPLGEPIRDDRAFLLRTGQPMTWLNKAPGHEAVIVPASAYRDSTGRWCRPYIVEYFDGDRFRHVACRDGDGLWDRPPGPQLAGY